jgi:hypothetical protein
MKFRCDGCVAQYVIPDAKLRGRRLDFPCPKCDLTAVLYDPASGTPAELAERYVRHAVVLAERGELEVALRTCQRAIDQLVQQAPEAHDALCAARHTHARLLDRADRPTHAADAYPGVVDGYEQLVSSGRADLAPQLVAALLDAAANGQRVGRLFVAIALGQRASVLVAQLAEAAGGPDVWPLAARAGHQLAESLMAVGNAAGAAPHAAAAVQTRAVLLGQSDDPASRFGLARSALLHARALEAVGQRPDAWREATRAAQLLEPLAHARHPEAGQAWVDALSFRAERLADLAPAGGAQAELGRAVAQLLERSG